MLVGIVLKSDPKRKHIVDIETKDHVEAMITAKEHYASRGIVRCFALIQGGLADSQEAA